MPPDPEADIVENIAFIRKIKELNPASEIILYMYTPTPGGSMYEQAEALGFRYPDTLDGLDQRRVDGLLAAAQPAHALGQPGAYGTAQQLRDGAQRPLSDGHRPENPAWHARSCRRSARGVTARLYDFPLELRAMFKYISYRRPELEGLSTPRRRRPAR